MKFDKKYVQPLLAGVALVSLFIFPFCTGGYGFRLNGFTVAMNTYIGYFLIALPAALLAAPFSPKYQAKLPRLSLIIPVLCIVSWLLCVLFAKTIVSDLTNTSLAIGAYITLICYIALAVYGFITYRSAFDQLKNDLTGKNKK